MKLQDDLVLCHVMCFPTATKSSSLSYSSLLSTYRRTADVVLTAGRRSLIRNADYDYIRVKTSFESAERSVLLITATLCTSPLDCQSLIISFDSGEDESNLPRVGCLRPPVAPSSSSSDRKEN